MDDVYIGAPAVVNRKGVRHVVEMKLNDKEKEEMANSAATLKKVLDDAMKDY
ncbi:L-lactate dehydrogenase [Listeria cornellensis FSL F6-0969]|uniref:L-lactate dehydrogenase n=1 Tax=Listeria cornellensis FSL F6-0969 TaxID=1265820 RepID=W7C2X5_9LIST|nr:L-lactate dehydrogenase [Listeria cornellensis FSL F6-0969]